MDKEKEKENENETLENIKENDDNFAPKERLSRISINNFYGNEYDKIYLSMKEMEDTTKKYFKDIENQIFEKFKEFNSNLENYFVNLTNQFSQAFGLEKENIDQETIKLIQSKTKKNFEKMEKIKNMYEQILESI